MTRDTLRKGAQIALVVGALVAASGSAYVFVAGQQEPDGSMVTDELEVEATPGAGSVGMRPFLAVRGPTLGEEVEIRFCVPDTDERATDGCVDLATIATGESAQVQAIPRALEVGGTERAVTPGTYALRAGPIEDGTYPVAGTFNVIPFTMGQAPEPRSFAGVATAAIRLGEAREIARDVACRPVYTPDGRLFIAPIVLDPRTGVTWELEVAGADFAWSPDGERLAIVTADRKEIRIAQPDGSDSVTLVREARGLLSSIAWSPDGSALAYVARSEPGVGGGPGPPSVLVSQVDDVGTTRLGPGEGVAWSPVADRLAIVTGGGGIELADLTGERRAFMSGRQPAFSSDGALMVFVRPNGGTTGEARLARLDDETSNQLPVSDVCGMAFSPSGRAVAVVTGDGEESSLSLHRIELPEED